MCSQMPSIAEFIRSVERDKQYYDALHLQQEKLSRAKRELLEIYENCLPFLSVDADIQYVNELSSKQADYYSILLFLYENELKNMFQQNDLWFDAYSIAAFIKGKNNRRLIQKLRSTVQKYFDGQRRGSPKIKKLLEKKPSQRGRGRKTCYRPIGFFEAWARLHKCYCRVMTILRDTWVIMHAHAMEEYYTLPLRIKESQNNVLYFEKTLSELSETSKVRSDLLKSTFFACLRKKFQEEIIPQGILVEKDQVSELRKQRAILEDFLLSARGNLQRN